MSRKFETRCWLCGSNDLEPDSRGVRCRSCGTTFNILPKPGADPLTEHPDYGLGEKGKYSVKSASPSIHVKRRAAKARSDT